MKTFFEEINKVDIFLAQLIRKKKRHQLLVLRVRGVILHVSRRQGVYKQLYTYQFNNLKCKNPLKDTKPTTYSKS